MRGRSGQSIAYLSTPTTGACAICTICNNLPLGRGEVDASSEAGWWQSAQTQPLLPLRLDALHQAEGQPPAPQTPLHPPYINNAHGLCLREETHVPQSTCIAVLRPVQVARAVKIFCFSLWTASGFRCRNWPTALHGQAGSIDAGSPLTNSRGGWVHRVSRSLVLWGG